MFNITSRGSSVADVIASVRDVPARVIPYAAATALTRTVKVAQTDIIRAMRSSFDRPTPYTLNATFIVPASKDSLSARIAIKNQPGGGTTPEHFLFPEVFGGDRREKRFEAALRHAGFLQAGERAMPGAAVERDAYGNVSAATVRSILRQAGTGKGAKIFAGAIGRHRTRGLWQRDGRRVKPLFIFTKTLPHYSARFDFDAAAEKAVRDNFAIEFYKSASDILARH